MKIIFTTLILLVTLIPQIKSEAANGGYAGAFLQIPIGARPAAMGGAYLSLSNDGAGFFYNPGGLSSMRKTMISSSYRSMGLDRSLGYVSWVIPTQKNSVIGFSWLHAGSGSVAARNSDGDRLGFDISQSDNAFSVLFAKRFEDYLSAGFRGSYLVTNFSELTSFSVSIDVGFTFYLSQLFSREKRDLMFVKDIQAGLVVKNLAATYRWNNEDYYSAHSSDVFGSDQEDKFPIEVGIGTSARFFERKLILAADLIKIEHQAIKLRSGAEYFVTPQFALRSGMASKQFTAGAGFSFSLGSKVFAIDYAFSTDRYEEGSEHIFSFDLIF